MSLAGVSLGLCIVFVQPSCAPCPLPQDVETSCRDLGVVTSSTQGQTQMATLALHQRFAARKAPPAVPPGPCPWLDRALVAPGVDIEPRSGQQR